MKEKSAADRPQRESCPRIPASQLSTDDRGWIQALPKSIEALCWEDSPGIGADPGPRLVTFLPGSGLEEGAPKRWQDSSRPGIHCPASLKNRAPR